MVCARSPHASTLCQHMWNARISCATQWVSTLPGSSMQVVSVGSWYNPQGSGTSLFYHAAESGRRSSMLRLSAEWRSLHPRCTALELHMCWMGISLAVSCVRRLQSLAPTFAVPMFAALCRRLPTNRRETLRLRWPRRFGLVAVRCPRRCRRLAWTWAPCAAVEATNGPPSRQPTAELTHRPGPGSTT